MGVDSLLTALFSVSKFPIASYPWLATIYFVGSPCAKMESDFHHDIDRGSVVTIL